jgi:hypothetical protein
MYWFRHLRLLALVSALVFFGGCVPTDYCPVPSPIEPPVPGELGGGPPGFDSPCVGHTGSWNGEGSGLLGSSSVSVTTLPGGR